MAIHLPALTLPHGRLASDHLVQGLGVASLGLGIPPLLAPGRFGKALGIGDEPRHRATAAVVGVRELVAAAGLLGLASPAFLWARVGGDAMDLALLGRGIKHHDGKGLWRTVAATAAVVGITGLDAYAAATRSRGAATVVLHATTTIRKSPQEVYDRWRRLEDLPAFMAHVDQVTVTGPTTSHWKATAPFGRTVEWDAEITEDLPGHRIVWRSVQGSAIELFGDVRFTSAPGHRGTEIHATMRYAMPAGKLGEAVARYFGEEPHQQLDDDLRRFKQVVETGEVVRSDGAPGGKRARHEFPQHPARPLSNEELARELHA
ncbi:MAG: cyclase [Mycobacterium sp.]|nr:cyclase [Mycobacterium sp.]